MTGLGGWLAGDDAEDDHVWSEMVTYWDATGQLSAADLDGVDPRLMTADQFRDLGYAATYDGANPGRYDPVGTAEWAGPAGLAGGAWQASDDWRVQVADRGAYAPIAGWS